MGVYYNEIDPFATVWLQKLMDAGQIPQGTIDDRSIEDEKLTTTNRVSGIDSVS